MILRLALGFGLVVAASAALAKVDGQKKAAFVTILEKHDCRMHNIAPPAELVDDIVSAGLGPDDLRPIAQDMMQKGEAERQGEFLVLKTGACQ